MVAELRGSAGKSTMNAWGNGEKVDLTLVLKVSRYLPNHLQNEDVMFVFGKKNGASGQGNPLTFLQYIPKY